QWIDLGDVDIAAARSVKPPSGGTRLIDSSKGTLLAIAPREGFEDAVLGFDLYSTDQSGDLTPNTNWPIRRSFPAFVYGVFSYLGGASGVQAGESVKPGQTMILHSEAPVEQLTIHTPSGGTVSASRAAVGAFHFTDTGELGPYEVLEGTKVVQ